MTEVIGFSVFTLQLDTHHLHICKQKFFLSKYFMLFIIRLHVSICCKIRIEKL